MKSVRIPAKFFDAQVAEGWVECRPEARSERFVWVRADDPALPVLADLARMDADPYFLEEYGRRRSAAAAARSIGKAFAARPAGRARQAVAVSSGRRIPWGVIAGVGFATACVLPPATALHFAGTMAFVVGMSAVAARKLLALAGRR